MGGPTVNMPASKMLFTISCGQINLLFRTSNQLLLPGQVSTRYPANNFWGNHTSIVLGPFWRLFLVQLIVWSLPYIGEGTLVLHTQASSGRFVECIDVQRIARMRSFRSFIEPLSRIFEPFLLFNLNSHFGPFVWYNARWQNAS